MANPVPKFDPSVPHPDNNPSANLSGASLGATAAFATGAFENTRKSTSDTAKKEKKVKKEKPKEVIGRIDSEVQKVGGLVEALAQGIGTLTLNTYVQSQKSAELEKLLAQNTETLKQLREIAEQERAEAAEKSKEDKRKENEEIARLLPKYIKEGEEKIAKAKEVVSKKSEDVIKAVEWREKNKEKIEKAAIFKLEDTEYSVLLANEEKFKAVMDKYDDYADTLKDVLKYIGNAKKHSANLDNLPNVQAGEEALKQITREARDVKTSLDFVFSMIGQDELDEFNLFSSKELTQ